MRAIAGVVIVLMVGVLATLAILTAESSTAGGFMNMGSRVVEVEKDHAWCYVLLNDKVRGLNQLDIISCVPKKEKD